MNSLNTPLVPTTRNNKNKMSIWSRSLNAAFVLGPFSAAIYYSVKAHNTEDKTLKANY
jgi:hypothetical protein